MNLRCWTITKNSVESGVRTDEFSSIIPLPENKSGLVERVRLHVVPVMPGCKGPDDDGALAFGIEDSGEDTTSEDFVVAFSPEEWRLETDKTRLSVIEPRGNKDKALALIHAKQGRFLLHANGKGLYVEATSEGPSIGQASMASLMLSALGASAGLLPATCTEKPKPGTSKRRARK